MVIALSASGFYIRMWILEIFTFEIIFKSVKVPHETKIVQLTKNQLILTICKHSYARVNFRYILQCKSDSVWIITCPDLETCSTGCQFRLLSVGEFCLWKMDRYFQSCLANPVPVSYFYRICVLMTLTISYILFIQISIALYQSFFPLGLGLFVCSLLLQLFLLIYKS